MVSFNETDMDLNQTRLIGDYILGPRIGSGSFAVVWRSTHCLSGLQVAVKEIDKKLLSPKVSENLLKEISILSTINHPNIIRLFESIETEDRIFLVLEYCNGGDLAGFINRHGKVTEVVARHFMRQLAAGLSVLQEKHLIHRDLKPQNLLLSSNDATPLLKIGDFGFARSLTPQDLADTLCGSPLYMAPEIIQNKKYDAKADLWSVGAILFQLVTGKPPFDGNSQYQLFQNILTFTELRFPQGALEELHPDCVDLCRSLLRRNPVERLTFKEFFSHKFLREPRLSLAVKQSSTLSQMKSVLDQFDASASDTKSQLHSEHLRNAILSCASEHNNILIHGMVHGSTSDAKSVHGSMPHIVHDRMKKSVDDNQFSLDQQGVDDSLELIEKDYVIVDSHCAYMDSFCYSLESSLRDSCTTKVSACPSKQNEQDIAVSTQTREFTVISVDGVSNLQVHGSNPLSASSLSMLREVQGLSILHPSARLHLLNQYAQAIAEIAQEKYNAGHFLETFSIELVVLAIWKKALQVCDSWLSSAAGSELPETSSTNESTLVLGGTYLAIDRTDFTGPSSACKWAEEGFIVACDRAEKLSLLLRGMDAAAEMPDAMEIIFQKALAVGTSGAVDEYMENQGGAAVSYSKATLLLSFISGEATSLSLSPPFSLTSDDKQRIQSYISKLQSHQSHFSMVQPVPRYSPDSVTN